NLHMNNIEKVEEGVFAGSNNIKTIYLNSNSIRVIPKLLFENLSILREIDLSNNRIERIADRAFSDLHSLTKLYLQRNMIGEITSEMFQGLSSLQLLKLSSNQITKLSSYGLSTLVSVVSLELSSNVIQNIESDTFAGLIKLKNLVLSSNNIHRVKKHAFSNLPELESLNLDHNLIHLIEACAFNRLKKLRILQLNGNNLPFINDGMFHRLHNLQALELSSNQIDHLEIRDMQSLPSLTALNLANNLLSNISSASMKGLSHLKTLWLDENRFSSLKFADEIKLLNLTHLYLRNNQILLSKHILLKGLPQLETLALDGNFITHYENLLLGENANVSYLGFSRNKIKTIWHRPNEKINCTYLDLSHNMLEVIPYFETKDYVQVLNLSYNAIYDLSATDSSKSITFEAIDLSGNLIKSIPLKFFSRMPFHESLKEIYLSRNRLSNLEESCFISLLQLEKLSLDNNFIAKVNKDCIRNLTSLTELRLRRNLIRRLKTGTFNFNNSIQCLDLSWNMIKYIEEEALIGLDKLQILRLDHNRIITPTNLLTRSLQKLEILYLRDNQIEHLREEVFSNLISIKEIYLDGNKMDSLIDVTFTRLARLTILFLQHNNISFISKRCFTFLALISEILDIGFNDFANNIPDLMDELLHTDLRVTRLGISGNGLKTLWNSFNIGLVRKEIGLDISYNNLPAIEILKIINHIHPPYICDHYKRADRLHHNIFVKSCWLMYLGLSGLQLKRLPSPNLRHLEGYIAVLTLNNNFIKEFDVEDFFSGSDSNLLELQLAGNKLKKFTNRKNFRFLSLLLLNISDNSITNFCDNAWQKFAPKLRNVYADRSNIKKLSSRCLQRLSNLRFLSLKANPLLTISEKSLYGPQQLSTVFTSRDYFCCLVPAKVTACEPIIVESLTSCQNLLSHLSLRLYIWIIGGLAFIGNLLVLRLHWIKRHSSRSKGTSQLLIINLAVSDFLMSIYLLIIAISDQIHVNNYGVRAESWLRSPICALAFFLGSLSSIMSVISILLISVDLYFRCTNPFNYQNRNCRSEKFKVTVIILWLICIIFVAIPAVTSTNVAGNDRIYKYSSICMPSNVEDAFYRSWITIATVCMVCIWLTTCVLYALVLLKVHQSSQSVHKSAQLDRKLARKLFLILFTDLISWLPYYILIFKVILTGRIDIFTLKFVIILTLPMNSALNPYLYSFTCPASPGRALLSIRKSFSGRLRDYYSDPLRQVNHYFFKCNDNNDPQNNLEGPDVNITLNNTECLQTVDREGVVKRTVRESNV
ncbi:G-protein coupled receptor GRL101-like protein, partial [Trichoplax sp. H2]